MNERPSQTTIYTSKTWKYHNNHDNANEKEKIAESSLAERTNLGKCSIKSYSEMMQHRNSKQNFIHI